MAGVAVSFATRPVPLVPSCVVGVGPAAIALATRALRLDDRGLAALTGLTTDDALFLLGEGDALPWADGVRYLGRDPAAPLLLLPTEVALDVAPDLFQRAVVRQSKELLPPIAVLAAPRRLVSVAQARTVDRGILERWIHGAERRALG